MLEPTLAPGEGKSPGSPPSLEGDTQPSLALVCLGKEGLRSGRGGATHWEGDPGWTLVSLSAEWGQPVSFQPQLVPTKQMPLSSPCRAKLLGKKLAGHWLWLWRKLQGHTTEVY